MYTTTNSVPVITIDGPSGTGKGTIAALVAQHLGWHLLDSGALYRGLAYAALQQTLVLADEAAITALADQIELQLQGEHLLLNGAEISTQIRSEAVGTAASQIAAYPGVRARLLDWQRAAAQPPGLVADGRDMGSVVFPQAPLKLFLDASPEERAQRRYKQLKDKGVDANLSKLTEELCARDARDRGRAHSPLAVASGALVFDTTQFTIDEVFARVIAAITQAGLDSAP